MQLTVDGSRSCCGREGMLAGEEEEEAEVERWSGDEETRQFCWVVGGLEC